MASYYVKSAMLEVHFLQLFFWPGSDLVLATRDILRGIWKMVCKMAAFHFLYYCYFLMFWRSVVQRYLAHAATTLLADLVRSAQKFSSSNSCHISCVSKFCSQSVGSSTVKGAMFSCIEIGGAERQMLAPLCPVGLSLSSQVPACLCSQPQVAFLSNRWSVRPTRASGSTVCTNTTASLHQPP